MQIVPSAKLCREARFVDNGRIVLSAGVITGIEASLHLVKGLLGADEAARIARQIEYPASPAATSSSAATRLPHTRS